MLVQTIQAVPPVPQFLTLHPCPCTVASVQQCTALQNADALHFVLVLWFSASKRKPLVKDWVLTWQYRM